jgi:hypothetical protein
MFVFMALFTFFLLNAAAAAVESETLAVRDVRTE